MKRLACVWVFGLSAMVALAAPTFDGAKMTAKAEKVEVSKDLKEAFRELLSDEAVVVTDPAGKPLATIWFRKEIPAKATETQIKNGLTYREIPNTTLIGAIHFAQNWGDFRKQEIPKGTYTLRLALQPMDGDHMGTAPHSEFCLLAPAEKDTKPDNMDVKSLHELSALTFSGTHPAVLLLFPNAKPEAGVKWVSKGGGIWTVNLKRDLVAEKQKTTLGFSFVLTGHTTE